jgi:hypothetical protein
MMGKSKTCVEVPGLLLSLRSPPRVGGREESFLELRRAKGHLPPTPLDNKDKFSTFLNLIHSLKDLCPYCVPGTELGTRKQTRKTRQTRKG